MLCSKIISKLFNASFLFKCLHCNLIVNFIKQEFKTVQNELNDFEQNTSVNFAKLLKETIEEKKNPNSLLSLRKKKRKERETVDDRKRSKAFHEEDSKNIPITPWFNL